MQDFFKLAAKNKLIQIPGFWRAFLQINDISYKNHKFYVTKCKKSNFFLVHEKRKPCL